MITIDTNDFEINANEAMDIIIECIDSLSNEIINMIEINGEKYINNNGETLICLIRNNKVLYGTTLNTLMYNVQYNWRHKVINEPEIKTPTTVYDSMLWTLLYDAEYFFTNKLTENIKNKIVNIDRYNEPFNGRNKPNFHNAIFTAGKFFNENGEKIIVAIKRRDIVYGCKLSDIMNRSDMKKNEVENLFCIKIANYFGIIKH